MIPPHLRLINNLVHCSSQRLAPSIHLARQSFSTSSPQHSKLGRKLLKYSNDVSILVTPRTPDVSFPTCINQVVVKGPLGINTTPIHPFVNILMPDAPPGAPKRTLAVSVTDPSDRKQKAQWGTVRSLIENAIEGVTEGYTVPIRIVGVGYRAAVEGANLVLRVGYAHPVILEIPQGVSTSVPAPQRIMLQGINLEEITQFAAKIRRCRKPEPYNQKGIFVGDETIKKKEGKQR
ncbi:hypothetical protein SmJEL517_g03570 [Synchytrium microbalum]|uniref:Large ribosomal subunit protein uL6 alpha-beta domain-containing protein n=1 Tax=Synchytrium microbalum TaxID=1806994 RepID=A0A507BXW6_9FUNG|nr:uncharacterized protein SmJEL517_g03570 [Synchytrium microbalum]TPX33627.1 hypothetical protein SmJEL517_g03570 [Synchytrium microbalum]